MIVEFDQDGNFVTQHVQLITDDLNDGHVIVDVEWPVGIHKPVYDFNNKVVVEGLSAEEVVAKQQAATGITNLIVMVDTLTFKANEKSRLRMLSAISVAELTGEAETQWRLADGSKAIVTLAQLKQAHALATKALGVQVLSDD